MKAIYTINVKYLRLLMLLVFSLFPRPAAAYIFLLEHPLADRVATADIVVFGKITSQEMKTANRALYPDPKVKIRFHLRFFELSITETIKGKPTAKTVRVAVFDHAQSVQLKMGDEGCFALSEHFEQNFYILGTGMFIEKTSSVYDKESAFLRHCAKLRNDPEAGLISKNRDDRLLTSSILIYEYGHTPLRKLTQDLVEEPIDRQRSQLILQAIVEADWSFPPSTKPRTVFTLPFPEQMIPYLKLDSVSKEKWPKLSPFDEKYSNTIRAWLKDNTETARLQRMVPKKIE